MLLHQEDGDPIEVDPEQVEVEDEDPFLTQEEVDSVVSKRVSRAERTTRNELLGDDDFWAEMAENRGVELRDEDLMPKGSTQSDEVKQLRQRISELEPKAEKAEELESKIQDARETDLENNILRHADGVKEDLDDAFMRLAKDRFEYDPEEERHVPIDEDGNVIFDGGEPAGPDYVVDQMREERPSFFKDKSAADGPDVTPDGGSSETTEVSQDEYLEKAETMSEQEFSEWSEGVEITNQ